MPPEDLRDKMVDNGGYIDSSERELMVILSASRDLDNSTIVDVIWRPCLHHYPGATSLENYRAKGEDPRDVGRQPRPDPGSWLFLLIALPQYLEGVLKRTPDIYSSEVRRCL